MIVKRKPVSEEAAAKHAADVALARQFDDLLARARAHEDALRSAAAGGAPGAGGAQPGPARAGALRSAEADRAPLAGLHQLGQRLDGSLTAVMRAAFAAERAAIGPQGYDDRIYRRKAMATAPVRAGTMEAQRLLTLRESHRLTGIARLPRRPAV